MTKGGAVSSWQEGSGKASRGKAGSVGHGDGDGDGMAERLFRRAQARLTVVVTDESGMSTVEYAIGTVAAAAFGAILYTVVTGDSIVSALTNIISRALNTNV